MPNLKNLHYNKAMQNDPTIKSRSLAPNDAIADAEARRALLTGEALVQYGHILVAPETSTTVTLPEQKVTEPNPVPAATHPTDQPVG